MFYSQYTFMDLLGSAVGGAADASAGGTSDRGREQTAKANDAEAGKSQQGPTDSSVWDNSSTGGVGNMSARGAGSSGTPRAAAMWPNGLDAGGLWEGLKQPWPKF